MQFKKTSKCLMVLMLAAALLVAGCGGSAQPTPEVEVQPEDDFVPVVSATGIVVPYRWATLSMRTAGVIAEVVVGEDEEVSAGDPLVRLEGEEHLQSAITAARVELVAAQQALDALEKDPEVRLALTEQAVVDAQKEVEAAQRRINNLGASSQPDIDQARANVVLARDRLDKAQEDYEPYANKPEDNLVRAALLSKMAQAQKDYDAAVRLLNNLVGTAKPLDVSEAEAELALAQANLVKAERDFEILKDGPDPEAVALAEARLANATDQLAAAEAALEDLVLSAPFDSVVSEVYVRPSEWIGPGQPVLLLADLSQLRVETTDLNEIDVARVEVGDTATVTFDALPEVAVEGKVTRIATKADAGSGVNYTLVIELDQIPQELRWGMTAFVDIAIDR